MQRDIDKMVLLGHVVFIVVVIAFVVLMMSLLGCSNAPPPRVVSCPSKYTMICIHKMGKGPPTTRDGCSCYRRL